MKKNIFDRLDVIVPVVILILLISFIIDSSLKQNNGTLVYGLDDAYIHMSMAKNLVQHHIWGITPYAFTSSSSSIIWPLILAFVFMFTGVQIYIPLLLNIVFSVLLFYIIHIILRYFNINVFIRIPVQVLILFLAPLPSLIVSGMEHILQIDIYLLFLFLSSVMLAGDDEKFLTKTYRYINILLAVSVTLVRYEGIIFAVLIAVLFFLKKERSYSFILFFAAISPIIIYGIISIWNGWFFLPNSVILKGMNPADSIKDIILLLGYRFTLLKDNLHVYFFMLSTPLLIALFTFLSKKKYTTEIVIASIFWLLVIFHFLFLRYNWFFRYEAYIVVMGIITNTVLIYKFLLHKKPVFNLIRKPVVDRLVFASVIMAAILGFFYYTHHERANYGTAWTTKAMNERYLEHVISAEFIKSYYDNSTVVLNDVGTTGYFTNAKILDIYGLASFEPASFAPYLFTSRHEVYQSKAHSYREKFDEWIKEKKGEIAILQTGGYFIKGYIPDNWTKIGMWEIPSNVVFGDKEISFYSLNPDKEIELAKNLRKFSSSLPPEIKQSGLYTQSMANEGTKYRNKKDM